MFVDPTQGMLRTAYINDRITDSSTVDCPRRLHLKCRACDNVRCREIGVLLRTVTSVRDELRQTNRVGRLDVVVTVSSLHRHRLSSVCLSSNKQDCPSTWTLYGLHKITYAD